MTDSLTAIRRAAIVYGLVIEQYFVMTFANLMKFKKTTYTFRCLTVTLGLLATSAFSANAATFYGGFEDALRGDYDYNDLVFSLSANSLSLLSSGTYYSKPVLNATGPIGQNGTPFWNNSSLDGAAYNVGYCIYGGGNCNGGVALAPNAQYLAASNTSKTGSANDVLFSVAGGSVSTTVTLTITAANDFLGWYNTTSPAAVNYFTSSGTPTGTFTFTPTGTFGLVGKTGSNTFYSNTSVPQSTADNASHFAFFANPVNTPEPGTWALFGSALAGITALRRRIRKPLR